MPAARTVEPYTCEQCGAPFHPFKTSKVKRFCGRECVADWNNARPLADRFLEKVVKLPSGCWHMGSGHDRMYGKLFYKGQQLHGHRISWLVHKGEIPDGLFVCHNCPGGDNRWCVNPGHLFLGTIQDNNRDRLEKGGNTITSPKLTPDQVLSIRNEFKSGKTRKLLAIEYGVSISAIKKIIAVKTWTKVPA